MTIYCDHKFKIFNPQVKNILFENEKIVHLETCIKEDKPIINQRSPILKEDTNNETIKNRSTVENTPQLKETNNNLIKLIDSNDLYYPCIYSLNTENQEKHFLMFYCTKCGLINLIANTSEKEFEDELNCWENKKSHYNSIPQTIQHSMKKENSFNIQYYLETNIKNEEINESNYFLGVKDNQIKSLKLISMIDVSLLSKKSQDSQLKKFTFDFYKFNQRGIFNSKSSKQIKSKKEKEKSRSSLNNPYQKLIEENKNKKGINKLSILEKLHIWQKNLPFEQYYENIIEEISINKIFRKKSSLKSFDYTQNFNSKTFALYLSKRHSMLNDIKEMQNEFQYSEKVFHHACYIMDYFFTYSYKVFPEDILLAINHYYVSIACFLISGKHYYFIFS